MRTAFSHHLLPHQLRTPIAPDIVPGILYTRQTFGLSKKKYLYIVTPYDVSLSPRLVSYDSKKIRKQIYFIQIDVPHVCVALYTFA